MNLNAMFVVCPYAITAEDYAKYNTMRDIVSEYGYDFLNTMIIMRRWGRFSQISTILSMLTHWELENIQISWKIIFV